MTTELSEALVSQWMACKIEHPAALTRGKRYQVLAVETAKGQVRVRGDNTRHRWYSQLYFELSGRDVALLERITLDDPIQDPSCDAIEVTLHFSDGSRRWCLCATPQYFVRYAHEGVQPKLKQDGASEWTTLWFLGEELTTAQGQPFVAFALPHLVMVSKLSEDVLWKTLQHLDLQGALEASSRE